VPATPELTGLGTALLTGRGAGRADEPAAPPPARTIAPDAPLDPALRARFRNAVERARHWRE
jgi:hypothetical protein